MVVNVLFLLSMLVVFFNPFNIVVFPGGGFTRLNGYLGLALLYAPFVLFFLVIPFFLWGAWLVGINKIRNKMVIIGLTVCLISFSVTAVMLYEVYTYTGCDNDAGIGCYQNPLKFI